MNMETVKKRLKNMLDWSDRLGSDEIAEIRDIIQSIDKEDKDYFDKQLEDICKKDGNVFNTYLTILYKNESENSIGQVNMLYSKSNLGSDIERYLRMLNKEFKDFFKSMFSIFIQEAGKPNPIYPIVKLHLKEEDDGTK